jgi:hypothetical protein
MANDDFDLDIDDLDIDVDDLIEEEAKPKKKAPARKAAPSARQSPGKSAATRKAAPKPGAKTPAKTPSRKAAPKPKVAAKKPVPAKPATKPAAKKAPARKPATPAKAATKPAAKKTAPVKKAPVKTAPAKKAPAKKAATTKTAPRKKTPVANPQYGGLRLPLPEGKFGIQEIMDGTGYSARSVRYVLTRSGAKHDPKLGRFAYGKRDFERIVKFLNRPENRTGTGRVKPGLTIDFLAPKK